MFYCAENGEMSQERECDSCDRMSPEKSERAKLFEDIAHFVNDRISVNIDGGVLGILWQND